MFTFLAFDPSHFVFIFVFDTFLFLFYFSGRLASYLCAFQAAKRKIQFFLGCRYSAGTYLILFVSKFGVYSAKRELCRCFLRRVMVDLLEH